MLTLLAPPLRRFRFSADILGQPPASFTYATLIAAIAFSDITPDASGHCHIIFFSQPLHRMRRHAMLTYLCMPLSFCRFLQEATSHAKSRRFSRQAFSQAAFISLRLLTEAAEA